MKKILAKREGNILYLPKYVNAEMLMLEFFKSETVGITPLATKGEKYMVLTVHVHIDILDELIVYVNSNI